VNNPREVLKIGDEVQVKVLGVDPERNRISLSIRELEANPWELIQEKYGEGKLVQGKITKLTKFGAFASLAGLEDYGIEGLVHISELSDQRILHPSEAVQEGQDLTLRVLRVEPERRRIGLSLRRVDSADYVEQDWASAVQEQMQEVPVMDFDAELEAEAELAGLEQEPIQEVAAKQAEQLPAETEPEI
jgi:small subunit ribosomal protein S1